MSSFATRWSVSREHDVTPDHLNDDGSVRDAVVAGWLDEVRDAYLAQCAALHRTCARDGLTVQDRGGPHPSGATLGSPEAVVITASATEVLPKAFVIAVRIRPAGGERDDPVNTSCIVSIEDPAGVVHEIDDEIRDELIALEHAAAHFN